MTVVATLYLFYLAYAIASSPVGQKADKPSTSTSPFAGFLLGVTNPKAYLAFISLFGSFQVIVSNSTSDSLIKWTVVVIVMLVVDIIWLWIGVRLGQLSLTDRSERIINYLLALTIIVAAMAALA